MSGFLLLLILLSTIGCPLLLTLCGKGAKKPRPKEQPSTDNGPKTPHPEAPVGMPLFGSGKRDDDTLKHVKSLKSDRSAKHATPQTPTCPSSDNKTTNS